MRANMRSEFVGSFYFIYWNLILQISCKSTEFPERQMHLGKVRGRVTERLFGSPIEEYLGIPYAAPPTGKRRFQRPTEQEKWTGTRNATKLPPACWQGEVNAEYITRHMPEFDVDDQSEDCLYLNIFVPKSVEKNKTFAVMFYIHGGSNRAGMGAMLPGDILAAHGQIIVINFNYRLGLLGFLSSPENNFTGNNGLLDQVTAMKWVHSNIQYFDGDASRVTIVGHSAGAGDVGLHLVSPLTKGLFRNAVMMSGSPLAHWAMAMPNQHKGANINSKILRLALNAADIRLVDMRDLKAIESILSTLLPFSVVPFPAVVDNYYLKKHPRSSFQNGEFHGNAFLLSFTADESFSFGDSDTYYPFPSYLIRYKPFYPTICNFEDTLRKVYGDIEQTRRRLVEAEADMLFYASIIELADLIAESGVQRHVSVFEYDILQDPINPKRQDGTGVNHGDDIFYMFGVPLVGSKLTTYTQADIEVSKAEMTLYSNFVKSELLSLDGLTRLGSLYNTSHQSYSKMSFSSGNITIEQFQNFRESKMEFWNKIVPNTNNTCDASSKSSTIVLIHMFYYIFFYIVILLS